MSLKKEQYDSIMTEYAKIRDRHRRELEKRKMQAFARVPALQELTEKTPSLAMDLLRKRLAAGDEGPQAASLPGEDAPRGSADKNPVLPASPSARHTFKSGDKAKTSLRPGEDASRGSADEKPGLPAAQNTPKKGDEVLPASLSFRETAAKIALRKKQLLVENGFPEDFLEMAWDCPDCRDTGYIGTEKCHCLRRRETAILYGQSHLDALAQDADFSLLSEAFYTGEDLSHFCSARRICQRFVDEFGSVYRNIYLYGTVGTGKTMLSVCAAKALIEKGRSVLYFSAASLFEKLADCAFSAGGRDSLREFTSDLYGCDLLIIDDLGTEFTNAFVASQLFSCISERDLNRRPTIISTNLSLRELQTRYSDRVFSRVTSSYELCKLSGRDIRLQKRRRGRYG